MDDKQTNNETQEENESFALYVYRDYSEIPPNKDDESLLEVLTSVTPSSTKNQRLPMKLEAMLSDPTCTDIISWMPHGRAWRIHRPKTFVEEVLPRYFDNCNYGSFIRLVNAWGFRRFSKGIDRHAYYHELFLRGLPHLHNKMRRKVWKQKDPIVDKNNEPDLYEISRLHPLPPALGGTPSPQPFVRPRTAPPLPSDNEALWNSVLTRCFSSPLPFTTVHPISQAVAVEPLLHRPVIALDLRSNYLPGYPTYFQSQLTDSLNHSIEPNFQQLLSRIRSLNLESNNLWLSNKPPTLPTLPPFGLAPSPFSSPPTSANREILNQLGLTNNLRPFFRGDGDSEKDRFY